jgi:hypothetical protein
MMKIKVIVATRSKESEFFETTALGQSLKHSMPSYVDVRLFSENTLGLPLLYNAAIEECTEEPAVLVFVHDDLYLLDYFWSSRVLEGLAHFDLIGLAGNKRRLPKQPSWAFSSHELQWDEVQHLSGLLAHGRSFLPEQMGIYGPSRQAVKLLDGVFFAIRSQTLIDNCIRFDEQFNFHFYDVDFCRQLEYHGLRMGTWDIAAQHRSTGAFFSESWRHAYMKYLMKWGS